MTKDSFNRKKNYSNTKIIQLDPLGERLSNVGFTGGASKRMLKKSLFKTEAKKAFKETKDLKTTKDKKRVKFLDKYFDNLKSTALATRQKLKKELTKKDLELPSAIKQYANIKDSIIAKYRKKN